MTEAELYPFLQRHKLAVIGSVSEAGRPQSALVGIAVTQRLEIVFDTVTTSRKYPNLIAKPDCSFTIAWDGAQTVQYEGLAEEIRPPDLAAYQRIYFQAWPDGPNRLSWPGIVYFVVRPVWIRYSDFAVEPALVREFHFDPA
ncbi:MAG: pyridoxamine 5'-phosphate oxidase family protein [Bryobacteraceae bacterium]